MGERGGFLWLVREASVAALVIVACGNVTSAARLTPEQKCKNDLEWCVAEVKTALRGEEWQRALDLATVLVGEGPDKEGGKTIAANARVEEWFPQLWKAQALVGLKQWGKAEAELAGVVRKGDRESLEAAIKTGRMADEVRSWEQRIADASGSATGAQYRELLDGIARAEREGLIGLSEARRLQKGLERQIVGASRRFEKDQQPQSSLELLKQTIESAPEDMRRVLISELDGICVRLWRGGRERNSQGDLEAAERALMLAERVAAAHRDVAGEVSGENERRMRSITEQVFAVQLKIAIATSRGGGKLDANLKEQLRERLPAVNSKLALLGRVVLLAAELDSGGQSAVAPELKQFATQNEALVKGCVSNTALKALGL